MLDSRRIPAAIALAVVVAAFGLTASCGDNRTTTPPSTVPPVTTPTTTPTTQPPAACPFTNAEFYPYCYRLKSSQLLPVVESAIDKLIQDRPGLFDLTSEAAPGTRAYKVINKEGFLNGVVANLQAAGLCSERDLDDPNQQTIRAKNSDSFSEDFDLLLGNGYMRRGTGAYRQTCDPPNFPAVRPPDAPPVTSGCYRPFPPPIFKMNCRDYLNAGDHHVMDSTPIVADPLYCAAVGFTDGRAQCSIRNGDPGDRVACEDWRSGIAKDTGRPGPTWTKEDGSYCTGPESGCMNSPESQYQLWVYKPGKYRVCAQVGRCCLEPAGP